MTSCARVCFACKGNMSAGVTVKEEPRTMNKSAADVSFSACMNTSCGNPPPNNTTPGASVHRRNSKRHRLETLLGSAVCRIDDNITNETSRVVPLHFYYERHDEIHRHFV